MKQLSVVLAAATFLMSGVASAHEERNFDAGKRVFFEEIASTAPQRANEQSRAPRSHAPCIQGYAAGLYPCHKVDMLSHVDIGTLGVTFVNDMWGWTDPETGSDYALLGAGEGTIVIDVTKPLRPVVIGMLPTRTNDQFFWRDIKVYKDHAFIISEDTDHGMQVLDLRQVRDVDLSGGPVVLEQAAQYDGFSSSHNIAINEDTGFAYVVGADTCLGGLEIVDISDPANPQPAACFDQHGYVHDTQCIIYQGPDERFAGREICFNSAVEFLARNSLSIVDVTDKSNIVALSRVDYGSGISYSHQGWLTPDRKHFVHGDELDEFFGTTSTSTTRIWNVEDLTNPSLMSEVTNGNPSIDHNIYIRGNLSYNSNYTSGLRIFDIRKIDKGEYKEVAYFDMYPENDNTSFEGGTWSNYVFFKQRKLIAVSSMDRGLFLLKARVDLGN